MANKKEKISSDWVNIIFYLFAAILAAIVFTIRDKMHAVLFLVLIWVIMAILAIILKSIVLSGDREINNKDASNIFLSSFLSTMLIIGSTMLSINYVPIVGRAFENTVGYWWINNDELATALNAVFDNKTGQNVNLIATQLFYDSNDIDNQNFYNNINKITQFSNVVPNINSIDIDHIKINTLYDIIISKNKISEATLISLAAIASFYTSYVPITIPWMFN
jgi:hypothetical protein